MKKPISFKISATLYIIGVSFGLVRDLLNTFYYQVKPDFYYSNQFIFPIIVIAASIGVVLILKGLNWVRFVSLVFYLIGIIKLLLYPEYLSEELSFASILGVLILSSYLFRGISIYYLFNLDSNQYFKSKRLATN
jgi:hypothetical protein